MIAKVTTDDKALYVAFLAFFVSVVSCWVAYLAYRLQNRQHREARRTDIKVRLAGEGGGIFNVDVQNHGQAPEFLAEVLLLLSPERAMNVLLAGPLNDEIKPRGHTVVTVDSRGFVSEGESFRVGARLASLLLVSSEEYVYREGHPIAASFRPPQ